MYGFSYDEELPAGYQDADLEMRELEERARLERIDRCADAWLKRPEFEGWTADEVRDAAEQLVNERIRQERENGWKARGLLEESDAFEEEPAGQFSIGVEGEQRALAGLAPEGKPAPVSFKSDATEQAAREQLEELAPARRARLLDAQTTPGFTVAQKEPARHHCAACGADLERDHYVYSRHTGARFCWPGEGCNTYQEERER